MKKCALAIFFALLIPIAACKSPTQTASAPASGPAQYSAAYPAAPAATGSGFDYYLLNLSWSPEFCYSHPNAAECASHSAFVLHGLWPQNNNGTYPHDCSTAPGPADPHQYIDIYPDQGLLQHEWQTHGVCSGLSADAFFQTARAAARSIDIPPTLTSLTAQTSLPPDQIVTLFTASNPAIPAQSIVVSCGHNFLTAIEVCLDKRLHPIACSSVPSCRANTVRIPPP